MKFKHKFPILWRYLAFILPAVAWLYCHHWGNVAPAGDQINYYHWALYHFSFLLKGEFPLWNPYQSWGWFDIIVLQGVGLFNPFLLLTSLFRLVGLPSVITFSLSLVLIFFLCATSIFFLVKQLTRNSFVAWVAYVLFVFSTQGGLLFTQMLIPLIIGTIASFYWFLIAFYRAKDVHIQTKYFCGLVFVLMLVASTYMPTFFLLVFLAVFLSTALFSVKKIFRVFQVCVGFIRARPVFFLMGMASILLAFLPGVAWYLSNKFHHLIWLTARDGFGETGQALAPSLFMINVSGLTAQMAPLELFSGLGLGYATWSYVPMLIMILLGLGAFLPMPRWQRCVFVSSFFVILFCLADVTPVHEFIIQHIGLFRLQRNLYFGGPIIFVSFILLSSGVLTTLLSQEFKKWMKILFSLGIFFVHGGLLWILLQQEQIIGTSFATLIGSFVFFLLFVWGFFKCKPRIFAVVLFCLCVIQPFEVMHSYAKDFRPIKASLRRLKPANFSYLRPKKGERSAEEVPFNHFPKPMQDVSGFVNPGYYGMKHSYQLFKNVLGDDLKNYVSHKFVVYEQTKYMDPSSMNWEEVSSSLRDMLSMALVHSPSYEQVVGNSAAQPIIHETPQLQVTEFTSNRIKIRTDFPIRKFIVYNDSFHPWWSVYIDGKHASLVRANVAFKGVWVDSGVHTIEFKFGPWWVHGLAWGLTIIFVSWLFLLSFLFIKGEE